MYLVSELLCRMIANNPSSQSPTTHSTNHLNTTILILGFLILALKNIENREDTPDQLEHRVQNLSSKVQQSLTRLFKATYNNP